MAARESSKSFKKKIKDERSQYYVKILTRACKNTNTSLALILSQSKKTDESRKYKGIVCQGFLNGVCVAEGFDDTKGNEARNDCANQIIESILRNKIVVEKGLFKNLSAWQLKLQIPESNIGCQMLRRMGWTGGGLGKGERKGIVEPIVVNPVHERHGIGMPHDYQPSTSKWKKRKVQPVITHKFIQKFRNSDKHEIVITEPLIQEDYRLLQKLCDKKRLLYEFVPPFNHLVIRKPTNWESSETGQEITKDKKRNLERQISQIRKETSNLYTKQTHPTASCLKGFEGASHLPSTTNELLSNVVIKAEPLHNPTTTELVTTTRHPTSANTSALDPVDPFNFAADQHLLTISENVDNASLQQELLHSAVTENVTTCNPLTEDGPHTIRQPTKADLFDTLHEFGLGDDIREIFFRFLNSSEMELEISRNLTSKERLILYKISDEYGFHFVSFFHNKQDRSIVIRKS